MSVSIPSYLMNDTYWKPVIYLFTHQDKLRFYFTEQYFNITEGSIKVQSLNRVSQPWAKSEKFMLKLALHLFNERNKVNLSDMDYLDDDNKELAITAIKMRFRC